MTVPHSAELVSFNVAGGKRWLEWLGQNAGTFPNAQPKFGGL